MLVQTIHRLRGSGFAPPIIVGAEQHRSVIAAQLEDAAATVEVILLEPAGRSTSAAATLAAEWLRSTGRDELLLLMPADHVVAESEAFVAAVAAGEPSAADGAVVTFGISPSGPNTGYGYIEVETAAPQLQHPYPVARFVEKPDLQTATAYVESGRFFWNSGIFLVKTSRLLADVGRFLPQSLDAISRSLERSTKEGLFVRPEADAFGAAENISIDYGIMERLSDAVVVPVEMGWSDVGSWAAVWELGAKDAQGNVVNGSVLAIDARDCLLHNTTEAVITAVGLDNIAVIAVQDAIFVVPLDKVSEMRSLIAKLGDDKL